MSNLDELKELARGATPGPWKSAADWERAAVYSVSDDACPAGKRVVCSGNQNNHKRFNAEPWSGSDWNDAAFIAAANPAAVIELIERLEAAEARLDALAKQEQPLLKCSTHTRAAPAVPVKVTMDVQALAEDIVENLVDCGGADTEAVDRYIAWTVKRLNNAGVVSDE